ncbi:MAG: SUMF1/EgtB/PvdO family nonheme iron enzyme [Magnetococcales bacterium]|nr:SUMF1/EgtB/PvdO family nonheme iron enzyme [Magnetococcales bacterium]
MNCPIERVSWYDVREFIKKLNENGHERYRLPTEAEWEYACRSGGKPEKFCGGNNLDSLAWHSENADKQTHSVGEKAANSLGIHDMSGNVYEWVADWH